MLQSVHGERKEEGEGVKMKVYKCTLFSLREMFKCYYSVNSNARHDDETDGLPVWN